MIVAHDNIWNKFLKLRELVLVESFTSFRYIFDAWELMSFQKMSPGTSRRQHSQISLFLDVISCFNNLWFDRNNREEFPA